MAKARIRVELPPGLDPSYDDRIRAALQRAVSDDHDHDDALEKSHKPRALPHHFPQSRVALTEKLYADMMKKMIGEIVDVLAK